MVNQGMAHSGSHAKLTQQVRNQEDVIRHLKEKYETDTGKTLGIEHCIAQNDKYYVVSSEHVQKVLQERPSFTDVVKVWKFQPTRTISSISAQKTGSRLLSNARISAVSRKVGDVDLSGFWGRDMNLPSFVDLQNKCMSVGSGSIRMLRLVDNGLNDEYVNALVQIAKLGITQLDIHDNRIAWAGMKRLITALPEVCAHLEWLDIRANPCSEENGFLGGFMRMLPSLKFLRHLAFTNRIEYPEDRRNERSDLFKDIVPGRKPLNSQVRWAQTPMDPFSRIIMSLDTMKNLKSLSLRGSHFTPNAINCLALLLKSDRLNNLDLAHCFLGSNCEPILRVLKDCRSLITLNLSMNCLHDEQGTLICVAIEDSICMTDLDVSSNSLSDSTGLALCRALRSNDVLWRINLARNSFTEETGKELITATQHHPALSEIGDMDKHLFGIGMSERCAIARNMAKNSGEPVDDPHFEILDPDPTPQPWEALRPDGIW